MRIGLLDSDVIAYRSSILTEDIFEEDAIELCKRMHDNWIDMSDSDVCVPCLTHGTSFRREWWPDYKAQRRDKPRPRHLSAVMAYIKTMPNVVYHNSWEADDVIGFLHTMPHGQETIVVTVDKDLDQLPGLHCNPDKEIRYVVSEDDADLYRWLQILTGDPTDNYPGIPRVGPVKAHKILEDVETGDRESVVTEAYASKGLDQDYLFKMIQCATILSYTQELACRMLSSPDSNGDGTLTATLLSLTRSAG